MVLTCVGSAALVKTNRAWQTFSRSEAAPEGVRSLPVCRHILILTTDQA